MTHLRVSHCQIEADKAQEVVVNRTAEYTLTLCRAAAGVRLHFPPHGAVCVMCVRVHMFVRKSVRVCASSAQVTCVLRWRSARSASGSTR